MSNNKDFKVKNSIKSTVYHEAVGTVVSATVGYDIAGASYDSKSYNLELQDFDPFGVSLKSDGTKLYMLGRHYSSVFQYTLSTAYDVSTISYDSVSFSFSSQTTSAYDFYFTSDGTKLFVLGGTSVYQYTLSNAWDISTASYASKSFSVGTQESTPYAVSLSSTGNKLYVVGAGKNVYQYTLSTPFDVSTASYDSINFSVSSELTLVVALTFNGDGSQMFVGGNSGLLFRYNLTSNYNISTASYSNVSADLSSQVTGTIYSAYFGNGGQKLYAVNSSNNKFVFQYSTALNTAQLDLSTGSVFDYTLTSDVQVTLTNPAASGTSSGATLLLTGGVASTYDIGNAVYSNKSLDVSSQVTGSMGLKGITFNNNGTSLYILTGDAGVSTNDAVYQYTLSTAFDISTGSYANKTLNVGTRETTPTGLSFNTDGTKLFIIGYNDDLVETWSLSSGYDISTASYASQSFNISSQEDYARHINFNNNGTKMYITGNGSSRVQEYALSTAFNVTTASFTDNFNPTSQASAPFVTLFNSDGTKMYVQQSTGILYQYSLSTAFDVSTGSYDNISFTLTEGGGYQGLFIGNSGLSLYSASNDDSKVYQYSTAAPATITYDSTLQWSGGTAPTSPATVETDVITFNTTDGGTTYKSALAIDGAK